MSERESKFELPRSIERYLAALSRLYANEGETLLQEIIVNSKIRVHEEWSRDNWNGGTYGHGLYLSIPEPLFLRVARQKDDIQSRIKDDINKTHNVQDEFVEVVFLEMEVEEDRDWRKESGLLLANKRVVLPADTERIWGSKGFRVFLCHKSEVKGETGQLAERLRRYGITGFVAHKDIAATKEWQNEIEIALSSMDAFAAIITEGFHQSPWTNQEIGLALGRGVPIVPVKLGVDPEGFIGRLQALACSWETAALELAKVLVKHEPMIEAYVTAVEECCQFDDGNKLSEVLPAIDKLSDHHVNRLTAAFNKNGEVSGSYGFTGKWPSKFGPGLDAHLTRITGKEYRIRGDVIELVP